MTDSNPMRWVVLAVIAAALFALGIVTVVQSQVAAAKAQATVAAQASEAAMGRADEQVTRDLQGAGVVAAPFIEDVAAGHFADAYARLATPYREAVSLTAFTRSCKAAPILAGARDVRLTRLRSQTGGGAATLEASGILVSAAGVAVPVSFVFVRDGQWPRILAVSLAGVPVLQGVISPR